MSTISSCICLNSHIHLSRMCHGLYTVLKYECSLTEAEVSVGLTYSMKIDHHFWSSSARCVDTSPDVSTCPVSVLKHACHGFTEPMKCTILAFLPNLLWHNTTASMIYSTLYQSCDAAITNTFNLCQGSCPFVKIKFKDFSRTFKDHTKDI